MDVCCDHVMSPRESLFVKEPDIQRIDHQVLHTRLHWQCSYLQSFLLLLFYLFNFSCFVFGFGVWFVHVVSFPFFLCGPESGTHFLGACFDCVCVCVTTNSRRLPKAILSIPPLWFRFRRRRRRKFSKVFPKSFFFCWRKSDDQVIVSWTRKDCRHLLCRRWQFFSTSYMLTNGWPSHTHTQPLNCLPTWFLTHSTVRLIKNRPFIIHMPWWRSRSSWCVCALLRHAPPAPTRCRPIDDWIVNWARATGKVSLTSSGKIKEGSAIFLLMT